MSNTNISYVSVVYADAKKDNPGKILVTTEYLSPEGDTFELVSEAIPQNAILDSVYQETLRPETSSVYPYKVVVGRTQNGSAVIYAPNIETFVTASQNYYTPMKFERYEPSVIRSLDKTFLELEAPPAPEDLTDVEGE